MKNVSIFRKIKLFYVYKNIIKLNSEELKTKFNLRIDKAARLYTVLNIPKDLIGEAFSLKTSDINSISESYTKEFSKELSDYLDKKGLKELHDFYSINKVGKFSYLLVFGFSLFKSHKYYNMLYYVITPLIIIFMCIILYFLLNFYN